jgi:hypothetical protein
MCHGQHAATLQIGFLGIKLSNINQVGVYPCIKNT